MHEAGSARMRSVCASAKRDLMDQIIFVCVFVFDSWVQFNTLEPDDDDCFYYYE